jgi:hypothetical protein
VSSSNRVPRPPASTYAIAERANGAPEANAGNADDLVVVVRPMDCLTSGLICAQLHQSRAGS